MVESCPFGLDTCPITFYFLQEGVSGDVCMVKTGNIYVSKEGNIRSPYNAAIVSSLILFPVYKISKLFYIAITIMPSSLSFRIRSNHLATSRPIRLFVLAVCREHSGVTVAGGFHHWIFTTTVTVMLDNVNRDPDSDKPDS